MSFEKYRLSVFLFGLALFSFSEFFLSYQKRKHFRLKRWPHHFLLIGVGNFMVKLILPVGLVVLSNHPLVMNYGLFNQIQLPSIIEGLLTIVIFDFLIYWQHVLFHKIHFLWRFHRVHHSDVDLDATSALRFHPGEILFSIGYKAFFVALFGFKWEFIILFEMILNFSAMFNHSNLKINDSLDLFLRKFLVTPKMHLIHHSTEQFESDTNYGFCFSFWDKIFKTYTLKFKSQGVIGNKRFRSESDQNVFQLLIQPFK